MCHNSEILIINLNYKTNEIKSANFLIAIL